MYLTKANCLVLFLSLFLIACGGNEGENTQNEPAGNETSKNGGEQTPDYKADWKKFKKAMMSRDIKGVAAFASSDEIDSEALINAFYEVSDYATDLLAETKFKDLEETKTEQGTFLKFTHSYSPPEGDDGADVSIYFSKGEKGLLLDYYTADLYDPLDLSGAYVNSMGQVLKITNFKAGKSFDFKVKYGSGDCAFNDKGTAKIYSDTPVMAYWEDNEDPSITFSLAQDQIMIEPGTGWIGMDCAKFGDIDPLFKRK